MIDPEVQASAQRLKDSGRLAEAADLALRHAASNAGSAEAARWAFLFVVASSAFGRFGQALERIAPHLEALAKDADTMHALGYVCWVERQPDAAETALKAAIGLDPKRLQSYRQLAMVYLTTQRWTDAFLAIAAARGVFGQPELFADLHSVASFRMRGIDRVSFEIDGETYRFRLSCFNGQAMEADIHHANGMLVELEELRFLKQWVGQADNIVECGCLVGNHTVFFLRNLSPKRIDIFDASQQSLAEMAANVELNARESDEAEINCNHRAIGGESGQEIELLGETVETIALQQAIPPDADFVKIDIDGGELDALDGLVAALDRCRAKLMIEVRRDDVELFERRLGEIGYTLAHRIERSVDNNLFFSPPSG